MRLDQALAKIGVHVLSVENTSGQMTIFLRVSRDPQMSRRWNMAASRLVVASAKGKGSGTWDAEVAKVLYPQGTVVKYTWRVILTGNIKTAQRIFGEGALEALRAGVEVTSAPLVGNHPPKHDPANGKMKGGYMVGGSGDSAAAGMIVGHFTPGMG